MRETNGHEEWKSAMQKAQAILEEGRKEMERAAQMAKEKGQDAWEAAQKTGRKAWDDARVASANAWDDVKDKGEEAWEDAEKIVKKHPTKAVGISILVGIVLGA